MWVEAADAANNVHPELPQSGEVHLTFKIRASYI